MPDDETQRMIGALSARVQELEDFLHQHIGTQIGSSGSLYPHPDLVLRTAIFGDTQSKDFNQIDEDGILLTSSGTYGDTIVFKVGDNFMGGLYATSTRLILQRTGGLTRGLVGPSDAKLQLGEAFVDLGFGNDTYLRFNSAGVGSLFFGQNLGFRTATGGVELVANVGAIMQAGFFSLAPATITELTIATGAVTATRSHHTIDTESDASTDDLDTITATNAVDGTLIAILPANTARTIVVKHNTGNIKTTSGEDIELDSTDKYFAAIYFGTTWYELGGGSSAVDTLLVKPANESVTNSTSLQNDDDFIFAVAANTNYIVELELVMNSDSAMGFQCDFSIPSGTVYALTIWDELEGLVDSSSNNAASINWSTLSLTDLVLVHVRAGIVVGGTAGNAQFRWAQDVATVNTLTVYEGSHMLYRNE
jgi:hypothetical protein